MPLITLNMAVLAPTPMPTVRRVTAVKVGECLSRRNTWAKRMFMDKYYAVRQQKFAFFNATAGTQPLGLRLQSMPLRLQGRNRCFREWHGCRGKSFRVSPQPAQRLRLSAAPES